MKELNKKIEDWIEIEKVLPSGWAEMAKEKGALHGLTSDKIKLVEEHVQR